MLFVILCRSFIGSVSTLMCSFGSVPPYEGIKGRHEKRLYVLLTLPLIKLSMSPLKTGLQLWRSD